MCKRLLRLHSLGRGRNVCILHVGTNWDGSFTGSIVLFMFHYGSFSCQKYTQESKFLRVLSPFRSLFELALALFAHSSFLKEDVEI